MNDQELNDRLARAGVDFRRGPAGVPDLDAMLDEAVRPRHRNRAWLAAAASVVVIAGAVAGVQLARHSDSPNPVAHPSRPPATIQRDGKTLSYAGDETWRNATLDRSDPKSVYVYADNGDGRASWGYYCGPITVTARVTAQTATAVTVIAAKYVARPPTSQAPVACAEVGYPLARLKVTLAQPLGNRSLVDGNRKVARPVLDANAVMKVTYLPKGYAGGTATWSDENRNAFQRQYRGFGVILTVTSGPAILNRPKQVITEHTTIRGHAATVSHAAGYPKDMLVAWNEDSTHAVTLAQMAHQTSRTALSAAELIRIANSLR
ncbi:MAG TPA: hypothetical protein VHX59_02335 [Mycobacteriales bacterium]|jgi:hypothetical protein|nr:hypothetical protein [Mycobacteriales bacterium]